MQLILPHVEPTVMAIPSACPYEGCQGTHFSCDQEANEAIENTESEEVPIHRYKCLRYEKTFLVYPHKVSHAQTSQRVRGVSVMVYLLGLS